jgi:REP element-mobilizing transposase RayT
MSDRADARRARVDYLRAMARLRRHDLPDYGAYHLTMRGVDGCDIFLDDQDRQSFLRFMRLATVKSEWRLFAFCLMRNHFHLVVLGELERVSRGMHTLAFRHAQTCNRRPERRGHRYADRFHARVIRNAEHLGNACAYVLGNAERAGVRDWPWRGGEILDVYAGA